MNTRILVIKHGALGDFIQSDGAFAAIRYHHPDAHLTLLTDPKMQSVATLLPYFANILYDERRPFWDVRYHLGLRRMVRDAKFTRIYDLQNNHRTSVYFRFWYGIDASPWSGIAHGCAFPHHTTHRGQLHTVDRLKEQLQLAGLTHIPDPALNWLGQQTRHTLLPRAVLLVPGGAAHRPDKRWPYYTELAGRLVVEGYIPILVGSKAEQDVLTEIADKVPEAINLCGQTDLNDMAGLARQAVAAVGNDTGPMHIISLKGCPSVVLFSKASNPKRCGQRGAQVRIHQVEYLRDLSVDTVWDIFRELSHDK
jgi:ADP-heptose:LPS heptosyltransferase